MLRWKWWHQLPCLLGWLLMDTFFVFLHSDIDVHWRHPLMSSNDVHWRPLELRDDVNQSRQWTSMDANGRQWSIHVLWRRSFTSIHPNDLPGPQSSDWKGCSQSKTCCSYDPVPQYLSINFEPLEHQTGGEGFLLWSPALAAQALLLAHNVDWRLRGSTACPLPHPVRCSSVLKCVLRESRVGGHKGKKLWTDAIPCNRWTGAEGGQEQVSIFQDYFRKKMKKRFLKLSQTA